jgi:Mrp family chromosome partitioning ATPase
VEANLDRPQLAEDFGVDEGLGLIGLLTGRATPAEVYRPTGYDNLSILPAGRPSGERLGRILRSSRLPSVLEALRGDHDVVLVDLPGLLAHSDAPIVAGLTDGLLFVVRGGVTPAAMVDDALREIASSTVRGVVMNGARSSIPGWIRRFFGL